MDEGFRDRRTRRARRARGFAGPIISHAMHDDHQVLLHQAGADCAYLTMTQAGLGLADHTIEALGA